MELKLVVLHYHFRPGGVRRVIERAVPHLARPLQPALKEVVLAGGQAPDAEWFNAFCASLRGLRVVCWIEPALLYLAEQRRSPRTIRERLTRFFARRLGGLRGHECIVWAHNQGLGRNLLLTRELNRRCAALDIPLVLHHHDWWFDNRWRRWPEMRHAGFRSLAQVASVVFARHRNIRHASINRQDCALLRRHVGWQAGWLPNLTSRERPPAEIRVQAARHWLDRTLGVRGEPVWLVPCRLLRRKNLAEALLLTRWLRPKAWLVTTGGVTSADEQAYFEKLDHAARQNGWPLRLGVLATAKGRAPDVPELLAAGEAVLLTSLQEGFGLPYLEAAAAGRPLIARRLPNIAPDLKKFGFRWPQCYEDIWVPTRLFDWEAERGRQARRFNAWRQQLPSALRKQAHAPDALAARRRRPEMAFSRLTLTAQLEVLSQPVEASWTACAPLNPFLEVWRKCVASGGLRVARWPRSADRWLGGRTYATRFLNLLHARPRQVRKHGPAEAAQREFLSKTLVASNQYPLLWHPDT